MAPDSLDTVPTDARLSDLLVHAVRITQGDFFLIFDQFEEYFDYQPELSEPTLFERELADAMARPHLPVGFVIALRDDELSRLDRLTPMLPTLFSNPVSVRRLTADQARSAITEPLGVYNALPIEQRTHPGTFSVEPALVDAVVKKIKPGDMSVAESGQTTTRSDEIEAAYLQLVMTAIWNREVAVGSTTLHSETLVALGGVDDIVEHHFQAVMDQLSMEDRNIAAGMFAQLVTPSGRKIPHRLGDLAMYLGVPVERLKPVVARLVNGKILVSVGSEATVEAARTYAIRHDALGAAISRWRLRHVSTWDRARAVETQQVQVREAQAQAERDRTIARERARAAMRLRYASIALAALFVVAAGLSIHIWRQKSQIDQDLRAALVRGAAELLQADTRAAVAGTAAQTAEERLATYRAELERSKADVRSFERLVQSLKTDAALNERVAEIERIERERDDARQRIAAIEQQMDVLQPQVAELVRARNRAIQEAREKQQPVVVLQVRPRRTHD